MSRKSQKRLRICDLESTKFDQSLTDNTAFLSQHSIFTNMKLNCTSQKGGGNTIEQERQLEPKIQNELYSAACHKRRESTFLHWWSLYKHLVSRNLLLNITKQCLVSAGLQDTCATAAWVYCQTVNRHSQSFQHGQLLPIGNRMIHGQNCEFVDWSTHGLASSRTANVLKSNYYQIPIFKTISVSIASIWPLSAFSSPWFIQSTNWKIASWFVCKLSGKLSTHPHALIGWRSYCKNLLMGAGIHSKRSILSLLRSRRIAMRQSCCNDASRMGDKNSDMSPDEVLHKKRQLNTNEQLWMDLCACKIKSVQSRLNILTVSTEPSF